MNHKPQSRQWPVITLVATTAILLLHAAFIALGILD